MKTLGSFINKKTLTKNITVDQQTIFYIFQRIIKEEYGRQGAENITPLYFREKKIFIRVSGQTWTGEILLRRALIVAMVNKELGGEEVIDLAMMQ